MEQTIAAYRRHMDKIYAIKHALQILQLDGETAMPSAGVKSLTPTVGALAAESYRLLVDDEFVDILQRMQAQSAELSLFLRRESEEMLREWRKISCIPPDEYRDFQMAQSQSSHAWRSAKKNDDYALFEPHLAKMVDYSRRFAGYYAPDQPAYEVLLDDYERGLTCATLDAFFARIKDELVPLIDEVAARGRHIDDSFLKAYFPLAQQKQLADDIARLMTVDESRCRYAETEHPQTSGTDKYNVRIANHYYTDDLLSGLYSTVHELGHALYELNSADELFRSELAHGAGMAIHESQSRLFENNIGRSQAFIGMLLPRLQQLFPDSLSGVSAEQMYLAINNDRPGAIRTTAGELTYPLHILVRYELEQLLIGGDLDTRELPQLWREKYRQYLGLEIKDDQSGVLQDSHWSDGLFGYFPDYAIGSAYAAQICAAMARDIDLWGCVAAGDLQPPVAWLTERIYRSSGLLLPEQVIVNSCRAPFDASFYIDYLRDKYSQVFAL
ncbi:MAG: carboxypeptidase M32 [Bacillota bacterium]|nr:carboxypeptidase M32 [Bacillota bacterium]